VESKLPETNETDLPAVDDADVRLDGLGDYKGWRDELKQKNTPSLKYNPFEKLKPRERA